MPVRGQGEGEVSGLGRRMQRGGRDEKAPPNPTAATTKKKREKAPPATPVSSAGGGAARSAWNVGVPRQLVLRGALWVP